MIILVCFESSIIFYTNLITIMSRIQGTWTRTNGYVLFRSEWVNDGLWLWGQLSVASAFTYRNVFKPIREAGIFLWEESFVQFRKHDACSFFFYLLIGTFVFPFFSLPSFLSSVSILFTLRCAAAFQYFKMKFSSPFIDVVRLLMILSFAF